eukprot:g28389.t1
MRIKQRLSVHNVSTTVGQPDYLHNPEGRLWGQRGLPEGWKPGRDLQEFAEVLSEGKLLVDVDDDLQNFCALLTLPHTHQTGGPDAP